ncbi:MAG: hypothetical protein IJP38_07955 [Oscillospiraceae bacterium]|nr:hypothetical protein [Oscillospiraceae bacterium]
MKTKIYLLQHSYQYGENNEYDEVKVLGIFSSKLAAKKAIEFYKMLPGFKDFSEECFSIDMYTLDECEWQNGFYESMQ